MSSNAAAAAWLVCSACLCSGESQASDNIYMMRTDDGTIHIARSVLTSDYHLLLGSLPHVVINLPLKFRSELRTKLHPVLVETSRINHIDAALLDAMIIVESGYDPTATSDKGAVGLMQLMPSTADRYGVSNRTDINQSINAGAQYMAWLLNRYSNTEIALAAYNAGEGTVDKAGCVPAIKETQEYVKRVLQIYRREKI